MIGKKFRTTVAVAEVIPKKPLTPGELCALVSVSKRFLQYEVSAGRLKRTVLGTHVVRFLPRDIAIWLEGKAK
jgi:hypothetical protein